MFESRELRRRGAHPHALEVRRPRDGGKRTPGEAPNSYTFCIFPNLQRLRWHPGSRPRSRRSAAARPKRPRQERTKVVRASNRWDSLPSSMQRTRCGLRGVSQPPISHRTTLTLPAGTRAGADCHMLLTDRAKTIIRERTQAGTYEDRTEAKEPPYMAPTEDTSLYSMVSHRSLRS